MICTFFPSEQHVGRLIFNSWRLGILESWQPQFKLLFYQMLVHDFTGLSPRWKILLPAVLVGSAPCWSDHFHNSWNLCPPKLNNLHLKAKVPFKRTQWFEEPGRICRTKQKHNMSTAQLLTMKASMEHAGRWELHEQSHKAAHTGRTVVTQSYGQPQIMWRLKPSIKSWMIHRQIWFPLWS